MKATTADPSKRLDMYGRRDASFEKIIRVVDVNGDDFDLTGYSFQLQIFDTWFKTPKLEKDLQVSANEISIEITPEEMSFKKEDNFYFLRVTHPGGQIYLWLNGRFVVNHSLFDGIEDTTELTISLAESTVTLQISLPGGSGGTDHFLGKYISLMALEAAHASAEPGDYADVDPGAGTDAIRYIWDDEEGWVASGAPPAPDVFPADFTVTLASGKSLGRLVNGDVAEAEGLTAVEFIQSIASEYLAPIWSSFIMRNATNTGTQSTTVEVNEAISGSRVFQWVISERSGDVNTIDIYDNTAAATLLANTPNDGSQSVAIGSLAITTNGGTRSWKGIAHDTGSQPGNIDSSNFVVTARFYRFYGPVSEAPDTSAEVRGLTESDFQVSNGETFTLDTGSVERIFAVALPPGRTISSVIDLDALNANITADYELLGTVSVQDGGGTGTARNYNLYVCTNDVVYSSNHRHQITTA